MIVQPIQKTKNQKRKKYLPVQQIKDKMENNGKG